MIKRCFIGLFILLIGGSSFAKSPLDSLAKDTTVFLNDEVVITADRHEKVSFESAQAISVLNKVRINQLAPMSLPDALSSTHGIWMQRTNHGGGSPFIRGLTGYQTLLLIDGVRFNNTTFRSGPNQYLNTIDPLMIDRIEIVRGQGSVQYGSDAIGGVIQMMSHTPKFSPDEVSIDGYVYGKYLSDNMEKTGRLNLEVGMKNTAISIGATVKNFGDVVAGGELGKLNTTGYEEYSLDFKLVQKVGKNQLLTAAYQRLKQEEVPLYHKLVTGEYATYDFDPQQRDLGYVKWEIFSNKKWVKQIRITQSFQQSLEGRIKQKSNSIDIKEETDKVSTLGSVVEIISKPSNFWSISSGLEYYYDKVKSGAISYQENSSTVNQLRGLYPDNSSSGNFAVYSLHSFTKNKFNFSLGGRYNFYELKVADAIFGQTSITPSALVGNAGVTYKANSNLHIVGSAGTGFRAPNVNDVSSFGIADFRYETPNFNLKPEKSLNYEIGLKSKFERFSSNIYFYRNNLTDLITNVKSTFNGQSTIDGIQVYKRTNIGKAVIKGIECDIEYLLGKNIMARANLNYTHGENSDSKEPMRRIPPMYGNVGISWQVRPECRVNGTWSYAGTQDKLSSGDIDDDRIAEGGTPAWNTLDLGVNYIFNNIDIQAGTKNLFDKAYRMHGSGVDGIGRSFWIAARFNI
jgi:hemoglobin/transferrin/lactoferrin receptor protein